MKDINRKMDFNNNFSIGISDFKEIIKKKCIYVDKTLFIKDILKHQLLDM